ncbi:hypothetical protein J18TS1_41500 [Oceanobacillus oncorhynchi subsp. incaldanensis]|uniref:Uncharacterized protein n=1 Tax=Oceanobacillus aidingensis TaxID=645964 RepID=A0ABV9K397_9BACI|nr:hypothetical protein [Oceanobacillus oncorhynchi]MDM8099715.1 hypothetical protein [Oceanobacillus oncorhynchi]UUI41836.1 hypothetical protein NP440_10060 [Oceanobacillus oncorhynchi]GIO21050.1 hypothetical protein J18TS1_41500 [Oceanobacillus oncorhynchi subsp. incaldanensis]
MLWLILLAVLILGGYLIIKGSTRGYKILGYVIIGFTVVFAVVILSSIGVKTNNIINEQPSNEGDSIIVD